MGKNLGGSLAGPDDPIFKEGPTFYTRKSDRVSTPSTKPSPKTPGRPSGAGSKVPRRNQGPARDKQMTSAQKAQAAAYWDSLEAWTRNWNSPSEGQELVLAEPPSPPPKGRASSHEPWPVLEGARC